MEQEGVTVWYDLEGDYLEIIFQKKAGYFQETDCDRVVEKVDGEGNVLGFSVLNARVPTRRPLKAALT